MPPISVPHVFWPISSRASSQSGIVSSKPPVSLVHGNRRCQSWSSPIVEVVLVTSSPNKKAPTPPILVLLHIRRPSTLCPVPDPASLFRLSRVDLLAVPVLHYGGWRRRQTARLEDTTDGARPHHFQLARRLSFFVCVHS